MLFHSTVFSLPAPAVSLCTWYSYKNLLQHFSQVLLRSRFHPMVSWLRRTEWRTTAWTVPLSNLLKCPWFHMRRPSRPSIRTSLKATSIQKILSKRNTSWISLSQLLPFAKFSYIHRSAFEVFLLLCQPTNPLFIWTSFSEKNMYSSCSHPF